MIKRKIYDELLEWKNTSDGKTAVMLEGARRVGKSYIAEAYIVRTQTVFLFKGIEGQG